ncbi:MAG: hypothetical protein IRY83_13280 [Chloroflexi bacterium]|nr:hypothetical protein [Chloroflexota bacterium]
MIIIINQLPTSIVLDDGTVLGAAGTAEARARVRELSPRDRRRLVETGKVQIIEDKRDEKRKEK